jgi:uncharacterized protein (TIGR02118 family)
MAKRVLFLKRRGDLDVGTFRAGLTSGVAPTAHLHFTHDSGYRLHEPVYDAVVEADESVEALDPALVDPGASGSLVANEVVIVDGTPPTDAVTMFAFLNRLPSSDRATFQKYWRDHHGPIAGRVPGLRRYIQNHTIGDGDDPYDGIAQTWFDDLDAMRASATSPELARTRADEPNFMISGRLPFVVCVPVR